MRAQNFPTDAITIEAWLSTSDDCHLGTILSYALDSNSSNPHVATREFNHLVLWNQLDLLACHGYEFLDLWPDPQRSSCRAAFGGQRGTANFMGDESHWHHLAVTWTAASNGTVKVYRDGLLMVEVQTNKTSPLEPSGALMLGGEQDCYGGCVDAEQAYYGMMDEVRIWGVARSQSDIITGMRNSTSIASADGLVAYWKFDEPEGLTAASGYLKAKDHSGCGNDLPLISPPIYSKATITSGEGHLSTGMLSFQNNYAIATGATAMPARDFTVEFWARTPPVTATHHHDIPRTELFSYATLLVKDSAAVGQSALAFAESGISIAKDTTERNQTWVSGQRLNASTRGALTVHINTHDTAAGVRVAMVPASVGHHQLDFAVGWMDAEWHHIAVSWVQSNGETRLYFDGNPVKPYMRQDGLVLEIKSPSVGGADPHIAAGTLRRREGSLVLGQRQACLGGCFSPDASLTGDLADVRIWSVARSQALVREGMWQSRPTPPAVMASQPTFCSWRTTCRTWTHSRE